MIVIKYMLYSHLFQNTPAGTRTRNLPLRRRMPYPLGHGSLYITLYISSLHNNRNGKKQANWEDRTPDLLLTKQVLCH